MSEKSKGQVTRRRFIQGAGASVALFHIVPSYVLGGPNTTPPSEMVRIASIGVGGRGGVDVNGCAMGEGPNRGKNLIALCDVDEVRAAGTFKKFPNAKRYKDFRIMLDEVENQIDAVTVGTPDHIHAVATINAIKRHKHVYCEKPLTHSIHEVRTIMDAARQAGVVTQLGNQGHSSDRIRMLCEWVWDGAIGNVHEVHIGCNAFPQTYCRIRELSKLNEKHDVPATLDWNLWQGPVPARPYNPVFLPWNWRGWSPYGSGCLGDWFCHVADPAYWALHLDYPTTVKAEVTGWDPATQAMTFPAGTKITYQFPAKGNRGPVKVIWFEGSQPIPRPKMLEAGRKQPGTGGVLYGDKGAIMHGSHGAGGCIIIPQEKMKAYQPHMPKPTIPRAPGNNHHREFLTAIKEGRHADSDFVTYGGPLTLCALLGTIAMHFPDTVLQYNSSQGKFTNNDKANQLLNPPYRSGWSL